MKNSMTGFDILNQLEKSKSLLTTNKRMIMFVPTMSIMDSRHADDGYSCTILIGTYELTKNPSAEYPIGKAMIPIVNLFHEVSGHNEQIKTEFEKNTPLSKALALNYYACQGSNYYYEGFGPFDSNQYWTQPHEIAAQYMGIKSAYYYLSRKWGQEDATEAICAYEKFRQDNQCAFLDNHKTYTDVDSILNDLNKKFQKCVYAQRHYSYIEAKQFPHDSLLSLAATEKDFSYISRVEKCHNGLKSDWMMASAYIWHRDYNHEIQLKPVFKDISLEPNDAFRPLNPPIRPKPKIKELDLKRLDITKELQELEASQSEIQL